MEEHQRHPATLLESLSLHQQLLNRIIAMTEKITITEGITPTIIPFLFIHRYSYGDQASLIRSILTPSFCLILQGQKELHLGQNIISYHAGDYLASIIDMPASGKAIGATEESPYIGLLINFTTKEIASVVMEAGITVKSRNKIHSPAAFIGKSDTDLLDMFIRLLKLIDKPKEASFLSTLIKREMIFHLLTGDYGHLFLQQSLFDQQADGIGKAITWIKENFSQSFTVEELAKLSNMSVSGLHHKFKAITTMGPLQYQKQLRLQEARRLMLGGSLGATQAALTVGYESPSQFSREYRRLFGLPPLENIKTLREKSALGEAKNQ